MLYPRSMAMRAIILPDGAVVLDPGGGSPCLYACAVDPPGRVKLIAIGASDTSGDLIPSRLLPERRDRLPGPLRSLL